jgi:hypothetical protein
VIEKFAEPRRSGSGVSGDCEEHWFEIARISHGGKGNVREIRPIYGPNQVHCGYTSGIDEAAIKCIYGPGPIELKTASVADGCSLDFDRVERFDGMDLNACQVWICACWKTVVHRPILAETLGI